MKNPKKWLNPGNKGSKLKYFLTAKNTFFKDIFNKKKSKLSPLVLGEQPVKPKTEKPAKNAKEKVAKAKSNRQKIKKITVQPKPKRPNAPTGEF